MKQHRHGLDSGMVSFRIQGGFDAALKLCHNSTLFTLAESFGGIEKPFRDTRCDDAYRVAESYARAGRDSR